MEGKKDNKSVLMRELDVLPHTLRIEIIQKNLLKEHPLIGVGDPFLSGNKAHLTEWGTLNRSIYYSAFEQGNEARLVAYPPMSLAGEVALIIRSKHGDEDATTRLVLSNLKFVYSLAWKKLMAHGRELNKEDLDDLAHEGIAGMLDAITRYEVGKAVKLMSYAKWRIQEYMDRNVALEDIRLPIYLQARIGILAEVTNEFSQLYNKEPTLDDEDFCLEVVQRILKEELDLGERTRIDLKSEDVRKNYSQKIDNILKFLRNYVNGAYYIRDLIVDTTTDTHTSIGQIIASVIPTSSNSEWDPEIEVERRITKQEERRMADELKATILSIPDKRTLRNKLIFIEYMITKQTQEDLAKSAGIKQQRIGQIIKECTEAYKPYLIKLGLWDDYNI